MLSVVGGRNKTVANATVLFCWKLAPLKMAQAGGSFHVGFADMKTVIESPPTYAKGICGWRRGIRVERKKKSGRKHDSFAVMFSLIEAPAALAYASAAGGRGNLERERRVERKPL
jgi:hypothetical protein